MRAWAIGISAVDRALEIRTVEGWQLGVAVAQVSRKKISAVLFWSPPTRLSASDSKAINRPSALMAGSRLGRFASAPAESKLARANAVATTTGSIKGTETPLRGAELLTVTDALPAVATVPPLDGTVGDCGRPAMP